jgi:Ca2+-binding RTX toxin-like protein
MTRTNQTTERLHVANSLRWHSFATRGFGPALPAHADFIDGRGGRDVIVGKNDDNVQNPLIQLDADPATANQSLDNTDIQLGGAGNDVMIGGAGNDVQLGDSGDDIFIGGIEGGLGRPNSDIQFGGAGNDVSIWAPGDGSDFFHGGNGNRDAQVVGLIDRDPEGSRTVKLSPSQGYGGGLPSVDVSSLRNQCTIDKVEAQSGLGYDFLVRFRNAAGGLVVTLRMVDVEQVFCPSTNGQQATGIVYADLRQDNPQFQAVSLDQVQRLNPLVRSIIR